MKNKEQFDNSIKVLVKAYLEGTLLHSDVCACAVGNLIVGNYGYKIASHPEMPSFKTWFDTEGKQCFALWYDCIKNPDYSHKQIDSTGYSTKEIILIEGAFESEMDDADGYRGLCAVFDALIDIHKGSDKQLKLAKDKLN